MCGGAQWVVTPTVTVERHANAMDRVEPIGSGSVSYTHLTLPTSDLV